MSHKEDIKQSFTESDVLQYIHQVKTDECVNTLQTYKKDIDYNDISSKRNIQCQNKTNLSNQKIGMYSDDQVFMYTEKKDGPLYCFTYREIDFLLKNKKNPYTKKPLTNEFTKHLQKLKKDIRYKIPVYPLDKTLNMFHEPGTCFKMPDIGDNNIAYLISMTPTTIDSLPNDIPIYQDNDNIYHERYFITKTYDSADLGVVFIYKIRTRNPINFKSGIFLNKKEILRLIKVFTSDDIETVPASLTHDIKDSQVLKELEKFMKYTGETLSKKVLDKLKKLNIKEFFPVKAYRGMSFSNDNFIKRYKVGDTFSLYSLKRVQSWSSTHCVSEHFAASHKYGIIISTVLNPDDIAIDTRFLNIDRLKSLFWREQREIMTVPFNSDGTEKSFTVKVEAITYRTRKDPRHERITDIYNYKYYSDFPDKDLDILDYKLGAPISKTEAYDNFFNKTIDMTKIPKVQKDLIQGDKFIDPITLEETPISELLQLKECGTILSRDTIKELIDRNTSQWQERENVGFKSPITNTIYGNLVLYNYSGDFHPQKNGTLLIRTKTTRGIKDTNKSKPIINWYEISYLQPSGHPYIYRSNGTPVIMYYPKNESGKNIMVLMVECFKKGNLFAFDDRGRVRHGRVHKKTSLVNDEFGYPDDTYEMRITGELSDLGCTPYTMAFNFQIPEIADPYPEEKRWKIINDDYDDWSDDWSDDDWSNDE